MSKAIALNEKGIRYGPDESDEEHRCRIKEVTKVTETTRTIEIMDTPSSIKALVQAFRNAKEVNHG